MDATKLKVIRIVEKKATRADRAASMVLFWGCVGAAFYANHRWIGSGLFALLIFLLAFLSLFALAKALGDTEATMTEAEALAWLQARQPKTGA